MCLRSGLSAERGITWSAGAACGRAEASLLMEPPWSLLGLLWDSLRHAHSPGQPRWEPCE